MLWFPFCVRLSELAFFLHRWVSLLNAAMVSTKLRIYVSSEALSEDTIQVTLQLDEPGVAAHKWSWYFPGGISENETNQIVSK